MLNRKKQVPLLWVFAREPILDTTADNIMHIAKPYRDHKLAETCWAKAWALAQVLEYLQLLALDPGSTFFVASQSTLSIELDNRQVWQVISEQASVEVIEQHNFWSSLVASSGVWELLGLIYKYQEQHELNFTDSITLKWSHQLIIVGLRLSTWSLPFCQVEVLGRL